jgi:Ser/Thr protein kinase RdoA (MazF antagonist)
MSFPTEYASLSTKALLQLITANYAIDATTATITFLKRGFNDTYLIKEHSTNFILRVYKHQWRTLESVETELRLLTHLKEHAMSVAFPIADKNNNFIHSIDAPEGIRYAVLFAYAEGEKIRKLTTDQAYVLGVQTGKMHILTQDKNFGTTAHYYDIAHQFDTTLTSLKKILLDYPAAYLYLENLKTDFAAVFTPSAIAQLATGICHGDLQAENFHITNDNTITFFDFDFFGTGFLVYDIGVFMWYDHKNKTPEIIAAFLKGYQTQRLLSATELQLLPYFSTLRALFQMTLYCNISDGKQLPLWPAQQVAEFIKKVEKWMGNSKRK